MKKVSKILAYVLLGVIAVTVILCAIIKIDFKPEINVPSFASNGITIEKMDGDYAEDGLNNEQDYNKFIANYNNSFKLTILYSLFSGKIGSKLQRKHIASRPSFTGYKVTFVFDEDQILTEDGKEVPVADNSNEPIKYTKIIFSVEKSKGLEEKAIYLYAGEDDYYKLTTIANFDKLAKFIAELSMFKAEE